MRKKVLLCDLIVRKKLKKVYLFLTTGNNASLNVNATKTAPEILV